MDSETTLLIELLDLISKCPTVSSQQRDDAAHFSKTVSTMSEMPYEVARLLVNVKDVIECGPIGYAVSDTKQFHYISIVMEAQAILDEH